MRIEVRADGLVAKRAESALDRSRLERAAAVLKLAAHPGVVQMVEAGDDALVLERVDGPSLDQLGDRSVEEVAGWGAAVATTLADWHDIGCTHGAVLADHIIFHADGRPVLCGTGGAEVGGGGLEARKQRDVELLAGLIADRLPPGADARLVRRLRAAGGSTETPARWSAVRRAVVRPPSGARELARLLVEAVPGARLPTVGEPTTSEATVGEPAAKATPTGPLPRPGSQRWGRLRNPTALVAVAGLAASLLAFDLSRPNTHSSQPSATIRLSTAQGRFTLSAPGANADVTVLGRWWCARLTPAVLDPASGAVWIFRQWPGPGRPQAATLVARLRGATGLAVARGPGGCDRLSALAAHGPARPIDVGNRADG